MKNREQARKRTHTTFFAALAAAVFALSGCSLALEEAKQEGQDKLAGFFLTEEHINLGAPDIEVNRRGEIVIKDREERIYGTIGPDDTVRFDGLEGIGLYTLRTGREGESHEVHIYTGDDAFSDCYFSSGAEGDSTEATVYVTQGGGPQGFYFNPVYQTQEGEIYVVPGSGLFSGSGAEEGMSMSHTVSAETKEVLNGEEKKTTDSYTLHITWALRPRRTEILFLDQENRVIGKVAQEQVEELLAGEGACQVSAPREAAYLILEQALEGTEAERISRSICSRGEEELELMCDAGDGWLVKRQLSVVWE